MSNESIENVTPQEATRDRAELYIEKFIEELGLDPEDPHLEDTPERVMEAFFDELFAARGVDPAGELNTTFPAEGDQGLVVVDNIEVNSVCAHHFLPFRGVAHIGYLPNDEIVGLSKFSRLVDTAARRPQVQERLTRQIADAIEEKLDPKAVVVVVIAEHECMSCRGVEEANSTTRTSQIRGEMGEEMERKFYDVMDLNGDVV